MIRSKQLGIFLFAISAFMAVTTIRAQQAARTAPLAAVDANVLKNAGSPQDAHPGEWLSYGRSQSETRYSPLTQINTSNVNRLGL